MISQRIRVKVKNLWVATTQSQDYCLHIQRRHLPVGTLSYQTSPCPWRNWRHRLAKNGGQASRKAPAIFTMVLYKKSTKIHKSENEHEFQKWKFARFFFLLKIQVSARLQPLVFKGVFSSTRTQIPMAKSANRIRHRSQGWTPVTCWCRGCLKIPSGRSTHVYNYPPVVHDHWNPL